MKHIIRFLACFGFLLTAFSPVYGRPATVGPLLTGVAPGLSVKITGPAQRGRGTLSRTADEGYAVVDVIAADDIVDVILRGGQVSFSTVRGRRPGSVRADFSSPVPSDPSLVFSLSKLWGRGGINLRGTPQRANNYTAVVRISDPQGGQDNYRFRLEWRRSPAPGRSAGASGRGSVNRTPPGQRVSGRLLSSGASREGYVELKIDGVDDILDLKITGDQVNYAVAKGGSPRNVSAVFSAPLPRVPLSGFSISAREGRGEVVLMEGPDPSNNYTATVRIIDSESAQDNYRFRFSWEVAAGTSAPLAPDPAVAGPYYNQEIGQGSFQRIPAYAASSFQYTREGSFLFRAIVDETVYIKIENGQVLGMVERGRPMRVLDARFSQGFPQGALEILEITGVQGRGEVRIVEMPWSGNNYAIVVRIDDSRGGDDEYVFEMRWKQD